MDPATPPAGTPDGVRLTSLSHGGGCGCKIAPAILADLLRRSKLPPVFPDLLVGSNTADDAAVYRINEHQAVVATTDFFMPIVDEPFDFGRIAATNALSDIYAMGATPIMALAIVGMPLATLSHETIAAILQGGESICAAAGIPLAGGHSIDSVEPIYGLVALGLIDPQRIKRNAGARAGDTLLLGKPIGVGILSAALKRGVLDAKGYAAMLAVTTQLNRPGMALAALDGVHALTDVTGFGLLGHTLEMCRGAGLAARIDASQVPLLPGVAALVADGIATGASQRNWDSYGRDVTLSSALPDSVRVLLTDPQTSGGLLVACEPQTVDAVRSLFVEGGMSAVAIGEMADGSPHVSVS